MTCSHGYSSRVLAGRQQSHSRFHNQCNISGSVQRSMGNQLCGRGGSKGNYSGFVGPNGSVYTTSTQLPASSRDALSTDLTRNTGKLSLEGTDVPKEKGTIIRLTEDVEQFYAFKDELGRGQFGVTRLVEHKVTGEKYACKSILKRVLRTAQDVQDVEREIQVMYHLAGDPSIVALQAVHEDRKAIHIVMELCTGGELFDRITEQGHYSEKDAARMCRTIVKVVAHCHKMGVIHRDLKPENFLLTNSSPAADLKCIDFGLSAFFRPGQVFKDVVGSPYYVAPEVLRGRYSYQADMWSCGVILYILLCGIPPFWGETEQEIIDVILRGKYDFEGDPWPSISQEAKDCIQRLLVMDPQRRASADDILQHPWMKENGVASDKPLDNLIVTRMRRFGGLNALKRQAMQFIVQTLSPEELAGLRNTFMSLDKDGNGSITLQELKEGFRKMGTNLDDAELDSLVASIDENNNGEIDYEEFVTACINTHQWVQKEQVIREAFNSFDLDGDGTIDIFELHEALKRNGNKEMKEISMEVERILNEVDADGDGLIDYKEFRDMMLQGNEYVNRQLSNVSLQAAAAARAAGSAPR